MRKQQRICGGRGACAGTQALSCHQDEHFRGQGQGLSTHRALMCGFLEGWWPGRVCYE